MRNSSNTARLWDAWTRLNSRTETKHQLALRTKTNRQETLDWQASVVAVMPYLADHDLIEDALHSITNQTLKPDLLLIAVDNDANGQIGKTVAVRCEEILGNAIPYNVQSFSGLNGPYLMLNRLISESSDMSYIWLHDSDDISHPTRLEKQLMFTHHHRLDLCSSNELQRSSR
mgnify:CR=1 FL=1